MAYGRARIVGRIHSRVLLPASAENEQPMHRSRASYADRLTVGNLYQSAYSYRYRNSDRNSASDRHADKYADPDPHAYTDTDDSRKRSRRSNSQYAARILKGLLEVQRAFDRTDYNDTVRFERNRQRSYDSRRARHELLARRTWRTRDVLPH